MARLRLDELALVTTDDPTVAQAGAHGATREGAALPGADRRAARERDERDDHDEAPHGMHIMTQRNAARQSSASAGTAAGVIGVPVEWASHAS